MNLFQPPRPGRRRNVGRRSAAVALALAMGLGLLVVASPPASATCWWQDPITKLWWECADVAGEREVGYEAAWDEYYEENSRNAGNSSGTNGTGQQASSSQQGESGEGSEDNDDPCKIDGLANLCAVCTNDPDACDETIKTLLDQASDLADQLCGSNKGCQIFVTSVYVHSAYAAGQGHQLPYSLSKALRDDAGWSNNELMALYDWSDYTARRAIYEASLQDFNNDGDRTRFIQRRVRSLVRQLMAEIQQGDDIGA